MIQLRRKAAETKCSLQAVHLGPTWGPPGACGLLEVSSMENFGIPPSYLAALDVIPNLGRGNPPMLYHYTDFNGLKGILESRSLRATYLKALSDSTEQLHGEDVVCRMLKDCTSTALHSRIEEGMKAPQRYQRWFVTCFCTRPTLSNMWETYASRGGGYCLGFSVPELPLKRSSPELRFVFRVIYDERDNTLTDSIRRVAKRVEEDPAESFAFEVACILASSIKHPSFKDENEWRIVVHHPPIENMNFRQGPNNIIPYISLEWNQTPGSSPLRKVLCGPTIRCDDELKQIITWMLKKYGYSFPTVDVREADA